MYIEFKFDEDDPNDLRAIIIYQDMLRWTEKYNTTFKLKIVKKTIRAFLKTQEYYSMFALTWNDFASSDIATKYWRLVEPMSSPKTN